MSRGGSLGGIRGLDASLLAGLLWGLRLGDLGADVLKIEPPEQALDIERGVGQGRH